MKKIKLFAVLSAIVFSTSASANFSIGCVQEANNLAEAADANYLAQTNNPGSAQAIEAKAAYDNANVMYTMCLASQTPVHSGPQD